MQPRSSRRTILLGATATLLLSLLGSVTWYGVQQAGRNQARFEGQLWEAPLNAAPTDLVVLSAWPGTSVTFSFENCPRSVDCARAHEQLREAFAAWSEVSALTLRESAQGDIRVSWGLDGGPGFDFDGPGEVLAYGHLPTPGDPLSGDLYFDDSETWVLNTSEARYPRRIELRAVALHEIGHALGLGHSEDPRSIMWPRYQPGRSLGPLDILAMQFSYGLPDDSLTSFSTPAPAEEGSTERVVTLATLNLRSGPGVNHEIIAVMPAGTELSVLSMQGNWAEVEFEGQRGWASRGYLAAAP